MDTVDKNNHLSEENIAQYVDAMQADRMDEISLNHIEHVENCVQCHTQIVDLFGMMEQLNTSQTNKEEDTPQQNTVIRRIIRLAIAASVAGFAVYFYYLNSTPDAQPIANNPTQQEIREAPRPAQKQTADKATTPKPKDNSSISSSKDINKTPNSNNLYAANLIPSDDFEALIGTDLRSEALKILKPELNTHFKPHEMITFGCNFEKDRLLYITILNNREDKITRPEVIDSTYSINTIAEPGLYYWTIEDEEELLHVGKFFIDN